MAIDTVLDIEQPEALLAYLRAAGHIGADESPRIDVLAGGVSNRTVLVTRKGGESWVLKQALSKLRVAVDWFSDPRRVHREALGIRWLNKLAPADTVPRLVFEDPAHHLIAMTAVPRPHDNWKTLLLAGRVETDHIEQFARLLGGVHRLAHECREAVRLVFADTGYFESLRLEPYYGYSAAQAPEAATFLNELIAHTRQRRYTLVHGDYSPKNILVHANRLVLLDHEVIHWGDPAFDLGFSLTHLLSKAHHLPTHRARFAQSAQRYWCVYRKSLGDAPFAHDLETWAVRHALACLLARVVGRSPLEYLSQAERACQRAAVTALMRDPPTCVEALVARFIAMVSAPNPNPAP